MVLLTPSPQAAGPGLASALAPPGEARSEGAERWWCRGQGRDRIRLALLGGAASAGEPLTALIPLDSSLPTRLESLSRLWRSLQGRAGGSDAVTPQRRQRLKAMLRAIDARFEGAAYREIASALYGAARVSSEPWKTSALRDTTLRLVRDGRAMIAGGYHALLR